MTRSDEEIYHEARKRHDETARAAYLNDACGDDLALRAVVEALLSAELEAGAFLQSPHDAAEPPIGDASPPSGTTLFREVPGHVIGRYKLLQQIGEGGFGSVWMAEQREPVLRKVALKIIKLGMDTRQVIARFEAERQALALMDHPNIAKVLDAGATETGRPYFVMELCTGDSITEYCDRNRLSIAERLELFAQVCRAVQHAHQKGLIHRDIKPSNILVATQDGCPHAKVIDFGIAKATENRLTDKTLFTEHKQLIGTPQYMSPEQAEGSLDIDTRTDVYSLGVLLYELLTGTTPFDAKSLRSAAFDDMCRIIREVEPPKPSTRLSQNPDRLMAIASRRHVEPKRLGLLIRGELDWIVMKCLEKNRQRRYETANSLALDVQRFLAGEPVVAAPPSRSYRVRKFVRRNRVSVIVGTTITASLMLGVMGTTAGLIWALDERSRANIEAQQAVAAARKAEESNLAESKARRRAETISDFVATALRSGDAHNAGSRGRDAASHDMTILAAMDNAIADLDSGRFKEDPETEAALRGTIGVILLNNGKYAKAKPLLEQALAMREGLFTDESLRVAETMHQLSKLYGRQGDFAEAERLSRRALDIREKLLGPDHPDVAKVLSHLGAIQRGQGHHAQAELLFARALAIREKTFGADHTEVAQSLGDLGAVYQSLGRYEEAEPLLQRSLAIHEKALGPEHPDVAQCLNNLVILYYAQKRYVEAGELCERALEIREKVYGPQHPDVAQSLSNLAVQYSAQGRFAEAEPACARALAIREKNLGPDHPSVAQSLTALAGGYDAQGRYAESEPLLKRALAILEKGLGPAHPDVAQILNNLATNYYGQNRFADAAPLFERALTLREVAFGPEHPKVAETLYGIGLVDFDLRRYADAEGFFHRALTIRQKTLRADHPDLATTLTQLARARQALGKKADARKAFDDALAILRRIAPDGSVALARALRQSGSARLDNNEAAAALPELEQALAMAEKFAPPGDAQLSDYREMLAKCRDASVHATQPTKPGNDGASDSPN